MSKMQSALARLQAKHKSKVATEPALSATALAVNAVKTTVETVSCVGKNIGLEGLLNRTKSSTSAADKLVDKVKSREEAGLYTAPAVLSELEGCDGNEVMKKLRELDHALIAKTPSIGLLSIKIRQNLEQYPELTHILSDEQLGIICSGVLVHANINTEPKTKAAKGAAQQRKINDLSASVSFDDI